MKNKDADLVFLDIELAEGENGYICKTKYFYRPNYAQHGGTYQIKWERYEWSEQLQKYELNLKNRRSATKYWYNNMK